MTDAATAAPPSPYKGLAAFADSELDALFFFGREREIEVIAANLVAARLTVLYGPSGVGKTSLLRAGVAQRLRKEGAASVVFSSWTGDPIGGLLAAVEEEVRRVAPDVESPPPGSVAETLAAWRRRLGTDLYIVLDQFEEYFLYHADDGEGGPFRDLAEVIRRPDVRVHFLISIREDALAGLDAFKTTIPGLFGNSLRLDKLDRRAAKRAIHRPLERYNELVASDKAVEVEDELVQEILVSVAAGRIQLGDSGRGGADESEAELGQIEAPYLQLVLERLWQVERERGSQRLRLETLRELGGAERIVEDHLERAMASLSPREQDAAAAMYNHLVTPSGTKIAHRAGDLARYAAVEEGEVARVLDRLANERIVRAGEDGAAGPQYEIFHDVLADAVLAWRTRHEADRRLEQERQEAARRQRRLLVVAGIALVAVALLVGIAAYALSQRSSARDSTREAEAHDFAALAEGTLATSPERSLELALAASARARTTTVEDALRRALLGLRVTRRFRAGDPVPYPGPKRYEVSFSPSGDRLAVGNPGGEVRLYSTDARLDRTFRAWSASFDANGKRLITAGPDGTARVWDLRTGKQVMALRHRTVQTAAFSRDSSLIVTTGSGEVRIWGARSGRQLQSLRHRFGARSAAFNHDGTLVLTTSDEHSRVFDVRTGRLRAKLQHARAVARFASDSDLVATGGADKMVRLWDGRTGRLLKEIKGHVRGVVDVAFSAEGTLLASASTDATARVWNPKDGALVAILPGHTNHLTRLAFSRDGELLLTGNRDRLARVFDPDSGTLRATLAGHREAVTSVALTPDGHTAATASSDGVIRLWDSTPLPPLVVVERQPSPVSDVVFDENGRIVSARRAAILSEDARLSATTDKKGTVKVTEIASGNPVATLEHPDGVSVWSFSDDADTLVTGSRRGTIRVWNLAEGRAERTVQLGHPITTVAISRDGRRLVGSTAGVAYLWDAKGGKSVLGRQRDVPVGHLTSATFSGDGRFVVTTDRGHNARLFDVQTGRQVWVLSQAAIVSDADFSADDRWVVIAGPGYAGVVDVRTGERILLLNGNDRILTSAAFSHTGWRIATGGESGAVRTYDCRICGGIDELVELGEQRIAQLRRTP